MLLALLKLVFFSAAALGITALVVFKAVRALRANRPYRFGFLDGGLLFNGKEVHPRWMLGAAAVYFVGISAILAWPLGAYEWVAEQRSPCNDLVTAAELDELAPGAFSSVDVQQLDTSCRLSAWSASVDGRFEVELSGDLGRNLPYQLAEVGRQNAAFDGLVDRYRAAGIAAPAPTDPGSADGPGADGTTHRPVTLEEARVADNLYRVDRGHEVDLYLTAGQGGAHVTLSKRYFDGQDISTVQRYLGERGPSLVAPFVEAEAARYSGPSLVRRNLPWVFLAGCGFLLVGLVFFTRFRRARAMRRALLEDAE